MFVPSEWSKENRKFMESEESSDLIVSTIIRYRRRVRGFTGRALTRKQSELLDYYTYLVSIGYLKGTKK